MAFLVFLFTAFPSGMNSWELSDSKLPHVHSSFEKVHCLTRRELARHFQGRVNQRERSVTRHIFRTNSELWLCLIFNLLAHPNSRLGSPRKLRQKVIGPMVIHMLRQFDRPSGLAISSKSAGIVAGFSQERFSSAQAYSIKSRILNCDRRPNRGSNCESQ